jgi:signal transduction histidine kinase
VKLSTRLWLYGALLPSAVMLGALLLAGQAFRAALESSLDRALYAQAAAESVSLFDREEGPHLHMAESPLLEEVKPFAPTGELFDEAGRMLAHFPPTPHPEERPAPAIDGPASALSTSEDDGLRTRELLVRVRSGEARYVLRLTASLAQVDESVRTFHLVALTFVLGAGALLLVVQTLLGRRLTRRIGALGAHLEQLKRGELTTQPEPDAGGDEVADLREVLAATTTQLRRAREVQDRLLADAAHELRTPLTLMRTSLDLALRRERTPEELREALTEARAEVDRLAQLATALLDMAAAGRGWDTAEADLAVLVDEATEGARAEAEQRGTWFEVTAARPAKAKVNATALRQALDNLLSNALRFAPKGTAIHVTLAAHGGGWRLTVRDEGPGIPEAQREAVFAPFHRLDRGGGSGLGLAIVSEVLRQHGGRAWAEAPASGSGAAVTLELPAATSSA